MVWYSNKAVGAEALNGEHNERVRSKNFKKVLDKLLNVC